MTKFTPRGITLTGIGCKQAAREVLEALESVQGDRRNTGKIAFLKYALRCVEGWEVGNWYHNKYWQEDYLVTGLVIDIYRETWSVTVANNSEILRGAYRTHCTPWTYREDSVLPVSLDKLYDWQDQCVTHHVVHLVLQNPAEHLCCTVREEISFGAQDARPQMAEHTYDDSQEAWLARMG